MTEPKLPLEGGTGGRKWSLKDGIAEIKRELAVRERVYAHHILTKKLDPEEAAKRTRDLTGTLRFLEWALKHEKALRQIAGTE